MIQKARIALPPKIEGRESIKIMKLPRIQVQR